MKIENNSVEEIRRGWRHAEERGALECLVCGALFAEDEVFQVDGRFFQPEKAVRLHMQQEHGDYQTRLIDSESKYNMLTENQRQLFRLFAGGKADREIAAELGISASTVRHQKFMFREKAKQARQYLAIYENVFEGGSGISPIHDHAKMVDERYVVTDKEREQIRKTYFETLEPLVLKQFPVREKKKLVLLASIAEQFERGKRYGEKEVNAVLRSIYSDYATLRRYLVEYGFMRRTDDCAEYWRS